MSDANSEQVGGKHYQSTFQHWDWVSLLNLPYLPAQVTKYLTRWKKKNGVQDLKKSLHFLDKFIEVELARHESFIVLSNNFLRINNIEVDEKAVINHLIRYALGDGDRLEAARAAIQRLIEEEEARAASGKKEAEEWVEELFETKEDLNATVSDRNLGGV